MDTHHNNWEEVGHTVKYDNFNSNDGFGRTSGSGELNFQQPSEDEADYPPGAYLKKGKVSRQQDPMSHRIIEKRRRDRMNNCLADLSRLIPPEYLKKGRGRVEKTEIIEMAIRHLKFLQERVNAAESQGDDFRAGYQEAATEAVRYLEKAHGYPPGEGLCVQLAAHLHRHCEHLVKAEPVTRDSREKTHRSHAGSSSETASSSSGSMSYKPGVIATAPPSGSHPHPHTRPYEPEMTLDQTYQPMDCDRVSSQVSSAPESDLVPEAKPLPLDGWRKREPTLRAVRKPEHHDDYLHSYKFKNSIERRFSRSQDTEALFAPQVFSSERENKGSFLRPAATTHAESDRILCEQAIEALTQRNANAHSHGKIYNHKRRRQAKPAPSTSTSNSGSTEEARDTSPQDTSSDSPHHHHYEKPAQQFVPVFALNSLGKYYVPLSVEYACVARHLGRYDLLDARAAHLAAPLHPVTIHVNFQPCINYHLKCEPSDRDWRPV